MRSWRGMVALALGVGTWACDPPIVRLAVPVEALSTCPPLSDVRSEDFEVSAFELPMTDERFAPTTRVARTRDGAFVVGYGGRTFLIDRDGVRVAPSTDSDPLLSAEDPRGTAHAMLLRNGQLLLDDTSWASIAFSDDGSVDLAALEDGFVVAYDADDRFEVGRFPDDVLLYEGPAAACAFGVKVEPMPNGDTLVTGPRAPAVVNAGRATVDLEAADLEEACGAYVGHPTLGLARLAPSLVCLLSRAGVEETCWRRSSKLYDGWMRFALGDGFLIVNYLGEAVWSSPDTEEEMMQLVLVPRFGRAYRDGFAVLAKNIQAEVAYQYHVTNATLFWFARRACRSYTREMRPRTP